MVNINRNNRVSSFIIEKPEGGKKVSPFKSRKQMKFMFAKKPKLAKKWASKYGVPKDLPEKSISEMLMNRKKK